MRTLSFTVIPLPGCSSGVDWTAVYDVAKMSIESGSLETHVSHKSAWTGRLLRLHNSWVIHGLWKEPHTACKEPTVSTVHQTGDVVHVVFDTSKQTLAAGVLRPGEETPTSERIGNDEPSIRRFVRGFREPGMLRTCYEAGPCGYELHRLLASLRVPCQVIAPALIPLAPGAQIKTDKRDARRLVRQFRAGELVAIRVPSREEEAVRDLCRARGDALEDLTRARNRLGHFLLRHGRSWRGGSTWTFKHRYWLAAGVVRPACAHRHLRPLPGDRRVPRGGAGGD